MNEEKIICTYVQINSKKSLQFRWISNLNPKNLDCSGESMERIICCISTKTEDQLRQSSKKAITDKIQLVIDEYANNNII